MQSSSLFLIARFPEPHHHTIFFLASGLPEHSDIFLISSPGHKPATDHKTFNAV